MVSGSGGTAVGSMLGEFTSRAKLPLDKQADVLVWGKYRGITLDFVIIVAENIVMTNER